jgi:hypothetical protein
MTKTDLLKKIEIILTDLERTRAWGTIEVELRDGQPNMIRRSINEKLTTQENTRDDRKAYRS